MRIQIFYYLLFHFLPAYVKIFLQALPSRVFLKGGEIVDIDKIILDANDKSLNDIFDKEFKQDFDFKDKEFESLVKQNKLLINYFNTLLREYHNELKNELAKQGINI